MPKILLVEDDNNLREIYEARLQAEGYATVSAHDGEEALVVAKAEKPDLIISDVMMPKISGFEMLDILRNTDSLKDVKIMMLTALGQNDDQQRADKLGADRYLVKSQVTLEDIVNVANELLNPQADSAASNAAAPVTSAPATNDNMQPPQPAASDDSFASTNTSVDPQTASTPMPVAVPSTDPALGSDNQTSDNQTQNGANSTDLGEPVNQEEQEVKSQIASFAESPSTAPMSNPAANPAATTDLNANPAIVPNPVPEEANSSSKKIIEPIPNSDPKPDINELLAKEQVIESIENNQAAPSSVPTPADNPMPAQPTDNPADPSNIAL